MNRWIIERQLVGRLSDADWIEVSRRVKRLNLRLSSILKRTHGTKRLPLYAFLWTLPFAGVLAFSHSGVRPMPGIIFTCIGIYTAWTNAPWKFFRSLRSLRLSRPELELTSPTRPSQVRDVYARWSFGIRIAALGALVTVTTGLPAGTLQIMLGSLSRTLQSPIVFPILGIVLMLLPVGLCTRLCYTAIFESRVATRRALAAKLKQPLRCLVCDHAALFGRQERCAECGYPNTLPPNLIPQSP